MKTLAEIAYREGRAFSYYPIMENSPMAGYAVKAPRSTRASVTAKALDQASIERFMAANQRVLDKDKQAQVSAWIDVATGRVSLEIVRVTKRDPNEQWDFNWQMTRSRGGVRGILDQSGQSILDQGGEPIEEQ